MKLKTRLFLSALFTCFFSVYAHAAVTTPVVPIQHWTLKNGARIYLVTLKNLPMVSLRAVFSAGSAYDGQRFGLSSLTSALIGEGTTSKTADQVADAFAQVGAQLQTHSGRDKAVVGLKTLTDSQYLPAAIAMYADVLNHFSVSRKTFLQIKNQTRSVIKLGQQNPGTLAKNAFYKAIYGNQPYAHPVGGTLASVSRLQSNTVMRFYRRYYVGSNVSFIIVGNVDRQHANKLAVQCVGGLPKGESAPALTPAPSRTTAAMVHIPFPSKQTNIFIGQVGISRQNPDYFPLIVGNQILGGTAFTSDLFREVRDKRGLAYFAASRFLPLRYRGPFLISLKTAASQSQSAINVVKTTLKKFVDSGPSAAQLTLAKKNMMGSFPLSLATNNNILRLVSSIAFYQRPLDYLDRYPRNVKRVTLSQIKHAFAQNIQLGHLVIVTVGPR